MNTEGNMSELNNEWKCPKCGALNTYGNFCGECGEPKAVAASFAPKPAPVPAPEPVASEVPAPAPEPVPQAAPAAASKPKESPKDEKHANILCAISLVCMHGVPALLGALMKLVDAFVYDEDVSMIFSGVMALLVFASWIAAVVLMIYVRVKYRNNVFGKVIMWIYIAETIAAIIATIVLVVACAAFLHECSQGAW
jgi:membrane protease subunit (stomatin/prohibitin family)